MSFLEVQGGPYPPVTGKRAWQVQKHDQPVEETYYFIFVYKKNPYLSVYFSLVLERQEGGKEEEGGKRNINQLPLICTLTGN